MYLVQLLLPLTSSADGQRARFEPVLDELTARFGGVTAFVNAPARGLWQTGGGTKEDRIVTVEVMVEEFEDAWWAGYRKTLEERFDQQELMVRAIEIARV
jgi:hypothetical protein